MALMNLSEFFKRNKILLVGIIFTIVTYLTFILTGISPIEPIYRFISDYSEYYIDSLLTALLVLLISALLHFYVGQKAKTKSLRESERNAHNLASSSLLTEKSAQDAKMKFQALFTENPEASINCDADLHILEANPLFCELFGYSLSEVKGKSIDELIVPEDKIEEANTLHSKAMDGIVYFDTGRKRKNGTLVPVSVSLAPLKGDGKISGFIALYKDISERRVLERKLQEYSEHLEELVGKRTEELKESQKKLLIAERLAAIGELAGMVGHDLRNPLMGIACAEYYLRTTLGPQLKDNEIHMLNIIKDDVAYSDKIVNDLQDYSKETELEVATTNPRSLLEESLSAANVPRNIQVSFETRDKPEMQIDPSGMKRVFINLIRNAVDAMPEGGRLAITANEEDGLVEFSFNDTGTGMPKELLEKIGKPLFTTKARGMGFGLAICKRIVEAHEGKFMIESTAGKGTSVKVILPIIHKTREEGKLRVSTVNCHAYAPESEV